MPYALSLSRGEEITISGKFIASGKKWANVWHGITTLVGSNSQQLLDAIDTQWGGICQTNISADINTLLYQCKQIIGVQPKFGTFFEVSLTIAAGVVTGATVIQGGSGYANGPEAGQIVDPTGTGATIELTFAGGSLSTALVATGGTGYSPGAVVAPGLPDGTANNSLVKLYGAQDFKSVSIFGSVALVTSDRLPSFNAYSIRGRSTAPGRYGRMAAHWPGLPESVTLIDNVAPATITAVTGEATNLYVNQYVPAGGGNWKQSTLSLTQLTRELQNPAAAIPPAFFYPIGTVACNPKVGSMLRRKAKN